jgi:hypothetical protein
MALVPGLNTVSSGTGHWTITPAAGDTIAIDDPGVEGQFPTVQLGVVLQSMVPQVINFTTPSVWPNPPDAIGFTAPTVMTITNNTGTILNGLVISLANEVPDLPLNLVPGVIQFGHDVNANYAYAVGTQPVAGETVSLFTPTNQPTTEGGIAASTIQLAGAIAPGQTVNLATVLHNTELFHSDNNFSMTVTPV